MTSTKPVDIISMINKDISCWKHLVNPDTTDSFVMAIQYLMGIHVNKDETKGIELLETNQDCSKYVNLLGYCYQNGIGVEKDLSKAVELYQRAVDMGEVHAMTNLGYCYRTGQGVEKNLSKAVELYQRAVNMGEVCAMTNLGYCYRTGQGIEKNLSKAVELYQRAVDMGDSIAMNNLGYCYQYGYGVDRDVSMAINLLQRSYELGETHSLVNIYNIGKQYENGSIRDYKKALELYTYAYDRGYEPAVEKINQDVSFLTMYMINKLRDELKGKA